jgi:hypothetical protein
VVQISSDLSKRRFLGASGRLLPVSLPIAIEPKPGACGRISETTTRQNLSPLIDRINDSHGRCTIGFGLTRSATDVLIQQLQDALQVHDSRRIVPVGYRLQRIGEVLDELNILRTLDDRCVHPIE